MRAISSEILDNAILEVSKMRGRLGAFERNTIQTNIRSLQVGLENITASESKIRDADFASRDRQALSRTDTQSGWAPPFWQTANTNGSERTRPASVRSSEENNLSGISVDNSLIRTAPSAENARGAVSSVQKSPAMILKYLGRDPPMKGVTAPVRSDHLPSYGEWARVL